MQKIVYLHIGLPKTATSHIQTTLQRNRAALEEIGLHYLQAGQHSLFHDNGNHLLAVSLMEARWTEIQLRLDKAEFATVWQTARDEIDASPAQGFIASSEWFAFDVYEHEQIKRIQTELAEYRVAVVVVLRDVADYVNSVYAQSVRDGYAGSVHEYIEEAWYSLNWSALVGRWADVFGKDNVMAFHFDDMRTAGVMPWFLRGIFGIDITLLESSSRNRSLPAHATMMLQEVNATNIDDEAKIAFRDLVKTFFERHADAFAAGSLVDKGTARLLRKNCLWPHLIRIGASPSPDET